MSHNPFLAQEPSYNPFRNPNTSSNSSSSSSSNVSSSTYVGANASAIANAYARPEIDRLKKTSQTIKKSLIVANDTEGIGTAILENLDKNKQKIQHAQDTVIEINGGLSSANKNLNSMSRRSTTNRAILCCVAFIAVAGLVILFLALLYLKLYSDKNKDMTMPDMSITTSTSSFTNETISAS
jgi:hypothetical protein